jgi:outer membrane receptor protein involved in Fe transport
LKINSTRERLLASSMICGVAFLGLSATQAAAADTTSGEVSEIVVTGTRIPTPNLTSVAPVTSMTAADIKAQGVSRVEDLLNSLPQAFAAQGSNVSNGADGTATVNLRGLGTNRTLVLIDGRRLMGGNPTSAILPVAADLNFIPTALVERVDVLTGGASAVYGADAVAGVVNFVMKKDFEGVQLDAQYSLYQHDQHADGIQNVVRGARATAAVPDNFNVPGNFTGGEGSQVSLTMGVNAPDGKGNITSYATYMSINPVTADKIDYTACALNSGSSFAAAGCGGSGTSYPARIGSFVVDPAGPGNTFRPYNPATDVYNFAPTNYLQRNDLRYSLGTFAHYQITPMFEAYADLMFMDDSSTAQIAPGGIFAAGGSGPGGTYQVNCNNPLMTLAQQQALCNVNGQNFAGTDHIQDVDIARRNVEGGGRLTTFDHQEQRYVVGLRGQLNEDWSYDTYLQYGKTSLTSTVGNTFVTSRINNSLLATKNAQGQIVCQSVVNGTDPACVPYNIFALNGVTQGALNYLQAPSFSTGNIIEQVANFNIVGQLPEAIKSPFANDRIGVSFGAEYRREHLDSQSDLAAASGQLNGSGGASPPVNGGYDVYELFGEARVPLIQDMPFIKDLTAELAYRYSDYSNAGVTNTYKIGGDWTIIDGFKLRAGYNRAVRAPNVVELFSPQNVVLDGTVDPCAGLTAGNPLVARCASLFNLTQAQVLALEPDPAKQYNGMTGGNPNLRPETSDTYTVGMVWQPTFVPGLSFTVDYFDINVKDYISGIGANTIINGCVDGSNPDYCSLVHRDSVGTLRSTSGYIIDTETNTGSLKTSGIDFSANYHTGLDQFGLNNAGSVSLAFNGTWLDKLEQTVVKGGTPFDCAGLYGTICSGASSPSAEPNPAWRHKMRLTWNTPFEYGMFGNFSLSGQWRFYSAVKLDAGSDQPGLNNPSLFSATDAKLGARSYFDLLASFKVKDNYSFRVGVNNVFDKDPPLTGQNSCPVGACNQNVYAQMYDSLGRYIFVGLTADF